MKPFFSQSSQEWKESPNQSLAYEYCLQCYSSTSPTTTKFKGLTAKSKPRN